jgi:hypothetical protein
MKMEQVYRQKCDGKSDENAEVVLRFILFFILIFN